MQNQTQDESYDWILVGAGLCGVALAYELSRQGDAVLLIDPNPESPGATHDSYGGIAYWAGTTDLTQTLCQQAIARHRQLSDELDFNTQFQERTLLLTVDADQDPAAVAAQYDRFMIQPEVLSRAEALEREPLLNPAAIAGALCLPHGHVSPRALVNGYRQAFERRGGVTQRGSVTEIVIDRGKAVGVRWVEPGGVQSQVLTKVLGDRIIICAGAWSRALLAQQKIHLPLYFTHAELIETPKAPFTMRTIVMPAVQQRFALEAEGGSSEQSPRWERNEGALMEPILDAGLVQFHDGHCCLGQISRIHTDLTFQVDAQQSEQQIRTQVQRVLPCATPLPGQWRSTRVAFSQDGLPLTGALPKMENLFLFSGFSSPFVYVPPIAQQFAQALYGSQPAPQPEPQPTSLTTPKTTIDTPQKDQPATQYKKGSFFSNKTFSPCRFMANKAIEQTP